MKELREYGIEPLIADPVADANEARALYGVQHTAMSDIRGMNAVILAVAYKELAALTIQQMNDPFGDGQKVLLDIKGLMNRDAYEHTGYRYWRL